MASDIESIGSVLAQAREHLRSCMALVGCVQGDQCRAEENAANLDFAVSWVHGEAEWLRENLAQLVQTLKELQVRING